MFNAIFTKLSPPTTKYSALRRVQFDGPKEADEEQELHTETTDSEGGFKQPTRHRWLVFTLTLLLGASILSNFAQYMDLLLDKDDMCSTYTSEYPSPVRQDIKVRYQTTKYNGSFLDQSGYRGPPGPETDRLWLDLGTRNRHYIVSEDQAHKYGLDPGHAKIDSKYGGGYPVLFQFEHDLHCLNFMRQALYWNYEYYAARGEGPFSNPPDVVEVHVGHCMDMLRQAIMCKPDLQVFGQYWIRDINRPFVDFNTNHKCVNFWELKNWVTEHQMSKELSGLKAIAKRPGDVVLEHIP